jgi:hypothetical protein
MSKIPIGTVFPAVAPSALVRVGIPTGDGFYMEEGSIPLESIIPSSGTWTPDITNQSGTATITVIGTSRYTQVGSVVTDICRLSVEMDTGQSYEEFNLSCAVLPATNFASTRDIIPLWSAVSAISEFDTVNIGAVASQKYGVVAVTMNGPAITAEFTVQRIYSIL